MSILKAELHCHNVFSNSHLGDKEPPYDCNVTIQEQMEYSHQQGLEVLFVTNHNTLDGYKNLLEYKNNHKKYAKIQVYPAEEVTIDSGAHILVYGLHKEIKPGLTIDELCDEAKVQNAVTSAPHPYSLLDALRDDSKKCDLIEVFNSNNVDILSNLKAAQFADLNNIAGVAGSDSHVISSLGKCVNTIEAESNLDDILSSMKHQRVKILRTDYVLPEETMAHLKYKAIHSKDYICDYINEHYPNSKWLLLFFHKIFEWNPNSYLWTLFYRLALFAMKRISYKINFENQDPNFVKDRNLGSYIRMAF